MIETVYKLKEDNPQNILVCTPDNPILEAPRDITHSGLSQMLTVSMLMSSSIFLLIKYNCVHVWQKLYLPAERYYY